jgi:hypothetical protein
MRIHSNGIFVWFTVFLHKNYCACVLCSQETVSFTHKKSPPRTAAKQRMLTTSKSLNRLDESLVTGTKMSPIR